MAWILTLAESDECGSLKSAHSFGLVLCQGVRVPAKYSSSYPNILATSSSFGFSESMSSLSSMASVAWNHIECALEMFFISSFITIVMIMIMIIMALRPKSKFLWVNNRGKMRQKNINVFPLNFLKCIVLDAPSLWILFFLVKRATRSRYGRTEIRLIHSCVTFSYH